MTTFYTENVKTYVSVDCIIFGCAEGKLEILLGRRKMDPGRGQWSLYGGFITENETLDQLSQRVLHELTGMTDVYMCQVGAYSDINRDPGSRVISVAYCALINKKDYKESLRKEYNLEWMSLDELPTLFSDHKTMIDDALKLIRRQINYEPLCFSLLPQLFTLTQLQTVHEAILGKELDKRNFRKRVKTNSSIVMTNKIDKVTSKRGAALYRYDENTEEYHF